MISDEELEHGRILQALATLTNENRMWQTNYTKFNRLDTASRTRWWAASKKQAEAGAFAPHALLVKVIQLRLTQ